MTLPELLLWIFVIAASVYAGYLIGRWSVLNDGTIDEYDEPTGAAYREYAGEEFSDATAPMPKGPATIPRDDWTPRQPRTSSAVPPPAMAGAPGSPGGGAQSKGGKRRKPSSSAKPPPAAAGLKS